MPLMTYKDIHERFGLSRKTCREWEKDGRFPRRVRLGPRKTGWVPAEIDAWEAERYREREAQPEAADVV